MIENIYKNVDFIDGNLKKIIIEALDRAFRNTRGKIPITFKNDNIGYCYKYTYDNNNVDLHTFVDNKDYSGKKIGFNLNDIKSSKDGRIVKAEVYDIIVY